MGSILVLTTTLERHNGNIWVWWLNFDTYWVGETTKIRYNLVVIKLKKKIRDLKLFVKFLFEFFVL